LFLATLLPSRGPVVLRNTAESLADILRNLTESTKGQTLSAYFGRFSSPFDGRVVHDAFPTFYDE
jgi:hypothetical protein